MIKKQLIVTGEDWQTSTLSLILHNAFTLYYSIRSQSGVFSMSTVTLTVVVCSENCDPKNADTTVVIVVVTYSCSILSVC